MKLDSIICVLGWEQRFPLGMEILLQKHEINTIILISFIDYKSMKGIDENKAIIENLCVKNDIKILPIELDYSDSIGNWKKLDTFFVDNNLRGEVLINTTTFPRETIWTLMFFLKKKLNHIHFAYFKPLEYDENWLTRNHKNPRLLFKHSGVFNLNKQLVLFIITGFDENRLEAMIEFYEPNKVVLLCQDGKQFNNLERNKGLNENNSIKLEKIIFNSYNIIEATETLNNLTKKYKDFNIIISSQGPKTSALSTYKSYLMSDNRIALAYVPAKDFSHKYSIGIDKEYIEGKLEFND